ncbi:MAG: hypothetical protein OXI50_15590 [Gammaproteobacteria bacterium]|nr:hypothetical protein [Gammaproteobacteria bacterium]
MTSKKTGGNGAAPTEGTGDGMNLLIGWRAGGEEAGAPARSAVEAAEPGAEAAADPAPALAATMAGLAAGQQRILALLEGLAPKQAEEAGGDAGAELGEAARSIAAATEWTNDIRAAMDSLLVTAGKSIRDLEKSERGLAGEVAALKTREEAFDRQIEALSGGARTLGARLSQLDEARQKLEARSAELQAVKQDIVGYYKEWTGAALAYRREMTALTNRLEEGENLVSRVEKAIGPWTVEIEHSLEKNAEAQRQAAERTSGAVQSLTESGDAFLEKFGAAWQGAVEDFRKEWRRTRRWSVPVLATVLALMTPALPVMGALGQSEFGFFSAYDDTNGWKDLVWEKHGERVAGCMQKAIRTKEPVKCNLEVRLK